MIWPPLIQSISPKRSADRNSASLFPVVHNTPGKMHMRPKTSTFKPEAHFCETDLAQQALLRRAVPPPSNQRFAYSKTGGALRHPSERRLLTGVVCLTFKVGCCNQTRWMLNAA